METNRELTKEVKTLAILLTKELQKNPALVTPEMLMALRSCADIIELRADLINLKNEKTSI